MARRIGKTWVGGIGWVQKKPTEERDYSTFEDKSWAFLIWTFRWWPDKLLDLMRSDGADYANEELIQRVMIRLYARYQNVDITGCRGLTKTSTKFKDRLTHGILWPGTKSAYYGPSYKQMADIGSKTFRQIEHDYPLLTSHWIVEAESKDDFRITTPYKSTFSITAIRGDNIHDVTAEEYAQEEQPPFDFIEYKRVVLPAVRLQHMVDGVADENFVPYQKHSITSAGRKQNHAYQTRCQHRAAMARGESSYILDVPWEVIVLSQMRPYEWAQDLRSELTPEEQMREMEARYTGADENPVIRDEKLSEACNLMVMENGHCGDPNIQYIVGYDVSYEDGARNAKCEAGVLRCDIQHDFLKRNNFLKSEVYMDGWPPPPDSMTQARRLKAIWHRFCYMGDSPDSKPTFIAIDGWQYGKAVVEDLMKDLGDSLPPLCIKDHACYTELEIDGALPVIYPIKAGGVGVTDPEVEMLRYAEIQFEANNVRLLTMNLNEGVEAYKRAHRIKDDYMDARIAEPYLRTRDLIGQIQNLKKNTTGQGTNEKRISKSIQRDKWSQLKYALRLAQIIEREELKDSVHKKTGWETELEKYRDSGVVGFSGATSMRGVGRTGGRRF